VNDYARIAGLLDREEGISAIEVNISCPSIPIFEGSAILALGSWKLAHKPLSCWFKARLTIFSGSK
jgi:hypothetical protein